MGEQRYGDPALPRVMRLLSPSGDHYAYMVRRPGQLPPAGPFTSLAEAEEQALEDKLEERKHAREHFLRHKAL